MSANNQLVVTGTKEDGYRVWMDSCVDNPFPSSASVIGEFDDVETAVMLCTEKQQTDIIEYGVRFMLDATVYCHNISEEDWRWCCGRRYGHDGDCDYIHRWDESDIQLEMALKNGACPNCSTEFSHTYHGVGDVCYRITGR
jgi:hypothetical protein